MVEVEVVVEVIMMFVAEESKIELFVCFGCYRRQEYVIGTLYHPVGGN